MKQINKPISVLTIALIFGSGAMSACSQSGQTSNQTNSNQAVSNQTASRQSDANQSKEIELPSTIKSREYEMNPDESILLLTVDSDGQISYQDKPLDDVALKNVLAEYNEKHKNDPSTSGVKYPSIFDDKYKSFYLKADARASFSQVHKVLKAVQDSSETSYITQVASY